MKIAVAPFDRARHLDAAASLLAERHVRDRERDPRLPAAYEIPAACAPGIEQALDATGASGVVATSGGDVVGFGVMGTSLIPQTHFLASFFPLRGVSIGYGAHASTAGAEYDVYREMYAALADEFVRRGYFDHSVQIAAKDVALREALVSVGFGQQMAAAVRDASPPERALGKVDVHQASTEDAPVINALAEELTLHHARSPIFNPYIRESDDAAHEMQRGLLESEENAHWVAYEGTKALGMNTFMPPSFLSTMTVPEKTIYLFQGIVAQDARAGGVGTAILARAAQWAREKGYDHIALHFATANISGARFWQTSGFVPVEYGMRRRIDERIAWAHT